MSVMNSDQWNQSEHAECDARTGATGRKHQLHGPELLNEESSTQLSVSSMPGNVSNVDKFKQTAGAAPTAIAGICKQGEPQREVFFGCTHTARQHQVCDVFWSR